jgi:Ni2+-binding GTPase involved in maturation of urease and hydrogenase
VAFNLDEWTEYVLAVNPHARINKTSALSGKGVGEWLADIDNVRQSFLASASA